MLHPALLAAVFAATEMFLVLAAAISPAWSQTVPGDLYTASGIDVDVTAESAAAARDRAILEGQRTALRIVLEQLAPPQDVARLRPLSDAEITDMIADFEIESEQTSAVRYIGKLGFRFRGEPVRQLLQQQSMATLGTEQHLDVLVPIGNLVQWTQVRQRLVGITAVRRADVIYLTRREGRLSLLYVGDQGQLVRSLAQRGLALTPSTTPPTWSLSLAVPPAGAESTVVAPEVEAATN